MRIDNAVAVTAGSARVNRIELASEVVYRRPRTFTVRAKPYPEDGLEPIARVEEDDVPVSPKLPRDWTFFVWDPVRGIWADDLDYAGVSSVNRDYPITVPRYDTWNSSIRAAQQQAFCDAIDLLPDGKDIIIVGSHAPEYYNAAMVTRIKRCGGSDAKLSWTARSSYILVGRTGVGAGNADYEVLNNITLNDDPNCAEITFTW